MLKRMFQLKKQRSQEEIDKYAANVTAIFLHFFFVNVCFVECTQLKNHKTTKALD